MIAAAAPRFTLGDTLPALTGVCRSDPGDGTGPAAVNGTGTTAEAHLLSPAGTVKNRTVTVGADGKWSLPWATGDLDAPGVWYVEVQLTFPGGSVETFGRQPFLVDQQIA